MIGLRMRTAALLAALFLGVAPAAGGAPAVAAADPVDLGGTPVESPSTDPANPTPLKAGLWSDTLGAGETPQATHQFSYRRTIEGSTVHVGVVAVSGVDDTSDQVELVGNVDGAEDGGNLECDEASESSEYNFPRSPFGVQIVFGPDEPDDLESQCLREDEVRFTVSRGNSTESASQQIAIKIVEEAPADDVKSLPAPPETVAPFQAPDPGGPGRAVEGADSFDAAPTLDSGVWTDSATEGTDRLYRVPLDWGQSFSVSLDVDALNARQLEETFGSGPYLQLTVVTPMRNTVSGDAEGVVTSGATGEEPLRLTNEVGKVRYLERWDGSSMFLPGDHWLLVSVQANDDADREDYDIPYTITLDVQGKAGDGEPDYKGKRDPFLVGDGSYSTVASGNPPPAAEDAAASNARRFAALGLGVFGLVCCGLGAVQLRRR